MLVAGKGHETGQEIAGRRPPVRRPRSCCAQRWRRRDDRADAGRDRRDRRRPLAARPTRTRWSTRPVEFDSRQVIRRRAVPRPARRARRRARLRRGRAGRRCGRRDRYPAGRRAQRSWCDDGFGRARRAGVGGAGPAAATTVVVGVTGSSGKTSTKDLLAQLLEHGSAPPSRRPARSTTSSATRTRCCSPTHATRFLVLETSARGIGHIRYLTRIAPPRIGVVLNVGSAHLGEFGSRAAIAQAKGELVEALPAAGEGGVAVLNADDPLVAAMAAAHVGPGRARSANRPTADVRADAIASSTSWAGPRSLCITAPGSPRSALRLVGAHHVGNALGGRGRRARVRADRLPSVADRAGPRQPAESRWRMEIDRAPGRGPDRQRRLQRQPRVDAGGARRHSRRMRPRHGAQRTVRRPRPDGRARRRRAGRTRRRRPARRAGWT